jgi:hypothetical protein
MDGVRVEETESWQEGSETWRVLRAYFPGSIETRSLINPLDRFALSSWMPFHFNADGSLVLYFQNQSLASPPTLTLSARSGSLFGVTRDDHPQALSVS